MDKNISILVSEEEIKQLEKVIPDLFPKTLKMLEERNIYPSWHVQYDGTYIEITCKSKYYNNKGKWFINRPKSEKDWILIEKYAYMKHFLECPLPQKCSTVRKLVKLLKSGE